MKVTMDIRGLSELNRKFQGLAKPNRWARELGAKLYRQGEKVITLAKTSYVPVKRGILRGSGHTDPPDYAGSKVSVDAGFGGPAAPYALDVHENPRAGKTGRPGNATHGQWKYLETPFDELKPEIVSEVGSEIVLAFEKAAR